jgi:AcrR family transcriptional regulator
MSKAPIWAVAAPGARKPRFSREQMARAALAIADADGFEALSMRRVAEELGAGTMTLYYYVRTKEDLLTLVEDALVGEIVEACEPVPKAWRAALSKLASAARTTYLRHDWSLRAISGVRVGPNALRHIEQSLQALTNVELALPHKLEILSIVDDYVTGHCLRHSDGHREPELDRKTARALSEAMERHLEEGDFPQLRALIGEDAPFDALMKHAGFMTEARHFEVGLDALLDGLAKRFKLK